MECNAESIVAVLYIHFLKPLFSKFSITKELPENHHWSKTPECFLPMLITCNAFSIATLWCHFSLSQLKLL
jgi:hypothetical protein